MGDTKALKENIIILAADEAYMDHAQSLMVNCKREGRWTGDFCVIVPEDNRETGKLQRWRKHGIHILAAPERGFMLKFWMFSPFFQQWNCALWLDCDVLIQGDLNPVAFLANEKILAAQEDGSILGSFWRDATAAHHLDLYLWIRDNYPHVTERTFNTSAVLFTPGSISEETPERLCQLQSRIEPANNPLQGGTDQQTINLLLYRQFCPVPHNLFSYWGIATGETVVCHYCRWYAPWLQKSSEAHAYRNPVLQRVCRDVYLHNLNGFEGEFQPVEKKK